MKNLLYILIIFVTASCKPEKPGKLQITNNVSNAKLVNIKWGDKYICSELLPGQSSSVKEFHKYNFKMPKTEKVSFTMTANHKSIYLLTNAAFTVSTGNTTNIVIDDNTAVYNPN